MESPAHGFRVAGLVLLLNVFSILALADPPSVTQPSDDGAALQHEQTAFRRALRELQTQIIRIMGPAVRSTRFEMIGNDTIHVNCQTQKVICHYLLNGKIEGVGPEDVPASAAGFAISAIISDKETWIHPPLEKCEQEHYSAPAGMAGPAGELIKAHWKKLVLHCGESEHQYHLKVTALLGADAPTSLTQRLPAIVEQLGRALPSPRPIQDPLSNYKAWLKITRPQSEISTRVLSRDDFIGEARKESHPEVYLRQCRLDLNNDGREDVAITNSGTHIFAGDDQCLWRIYIANPAGGYYYVGAPALSLWGFTVQPAAPGIARLTWSAGGPIIDSEESYVYEVNAKEVRFLKTERKTPSKTN